MQSGDMDLARLTRPTLKTPTPTKLQLRRKLYQSNSKQEAGKIDSFLKSNR
jgi:hypothetical protein